MTWTKLGDEFADECWTLTDKAFRLHTEGLLWSNRMLTDGQLAKDDMTRWARHPEAAEELVSIGWWTDRGGHYQIVHHLGYQRTREQVAKQSLANRANRAKGKARPVRGKSDSLNGSSDESSDEPALSSAKQETESVSAPRGKSQVANGSSDDSSDERDRTGQAWVSTRGDGSKNATDSFTPTAEQLRRIDENMRRGYDS
jgi:hypothetical protein